MKNKALKTAGVLCMICLFAAGCGIKEPQAESESAIYDDEGEPFAEETVDRDFSEFRTPCSQEAAYEYKNYFLPKVCGINQP